MPQLPASNSNGSQGLNLSSSLTHSLTNQLAALTALHYLKSSRVLCYDRRSVGQSVLVSSTYLGLMTTFLLLSDSCGFVDVGRSLWRESGSAVTVSVIRCMSRWWTYAIETWSEREVGKTLSDIWDGNMYIQSKYINTTGYLKTIFKKVLNRIFRKAYSYVVQFSCNTSRAQLKWSISCRRKTKTKYRFRVAIMRLICHKNKPEFTCYFENLAPHKFQLVRLISYLPQKCSVTYKFVV
jgi:hypothetical protein